MVIQLVLLTLKHYTRTLHIMYIMDTLGNQYTFPWVVIKYPYNYPPMIFVITSRFMVWFHIRPHIYLQSIIYQT